jgi:hypothetical protein
MKLTIGITTFSKRFDMLSKLIGQIRTYITDPIVVVVNGEQQIPGGCSVNFDDNYRKKVLELCSSYNDVYPVFFIEMRGLSKLWNTIINTSITNDILLLNDDIEVEVEAHPEEHLYRYIASDDFSGITRINGSFSHFLAKKDIINQIGYFDERLLGFGEEDGDIYYRLLKNNMQLSDIQVPGFFNIVSDIRHDHVKRGIGKYSKFNRDYIYEQKYETDPESPYRGMFDDHKKQIIEDINCYPLEEFYMNRKGEV